MDVLYPKDFDLTSIEKCMMDYDCHFIAYEDDEAINSRLGTNFVILQETCFIVHVGGATTGSGNEEFKCDYDCRNRVMKDLHPKKGEKFRGISATRGTDGIYYNNAAPYLLFTNECIRGYAGTDNTIIANYTRVDIPNFAEIAKSKRCNEKFFDVYLGNDDYICCNRQTLETYVYTSVTKHRVIQILCSESDDPFHQLKSEDEKLKLSKPLPRNSSDFHLKDIEGHTVEENTDYYLEIYDHDDDVLDMYEDELWSRYYEYQIEQTIVQCSIVNGIHYLVYGNKYLHVADESNAITLSNQVPYQHQRLQFQFTENNTFRTVQWNQCIFLILNILTCSSGSVQFTADDGPPLELYLKRV
ncbi:hypothetical protein K450DRAFT_281340 [Umbelopsis ramanniana AG]|uniref:Uncharacterized protein n=1 Tax=Umbelopsis ramanniana AG TaxID=1314678 RepID=A0AAD5E9L1_UMBRA|nr:uncharacterized protein K450DRAFT_281340 [Umbelopsis ramanniana AG]KAI8578855.1 hypothetical protein K450DRAFT_281340 [Umbelopsis ramanniana AG]